MNAKEIEPGDANQGAGTRVDFGIVVGVDHYPRFRSLSGAIADATRFHEWLCAPDGGQVAVQHARLIKSQPDPAKPVQDEIDEAFAELLSKACALGGGRRLYFQFSGHGASCPDRSGDDVALLLAKWSRTMARLALSSDAYGSELCGLGLFEEVAIFLDCCRNTGVGVVGLPPTFTIAAATRLSTRAFVAYATEPRRSAFETRDHDAWHGVFTRTLLKILRRSPTGVAAEQLKRDLERELATRGQRAHVANGLLAGSRFGAQGRLPCLEITFGSLRGAVRLLDGTNRTVDVHNATDQPWLLELAAGLYKLEHASSPSVLIDHGRDEVTRVAL